MAVPPPSARVQGDLPEEDMDVRGGGQAYEDRRVVKDEDGYGSDEEGGTGRRIRDVNYEAAAPPAASGGGAAGEVKHDEYKPGEANGGDAAFLNGVTAPAVGVGGLAVNGDEQGEGGENHAEPAPGSGDAMDTDGPAQ